MDKQLSSEGIAELAKALSKAQAEIKGAEKDSSNPFYNKKYADLGSVWDACRDPLTKNGLSVVQTLDMEDAYLIIKTVLLHSSGEWMTSRLPIKPVKADPQGVGSAITYARRYSLAAMVGVCPVDDDAEGAMGRDRGEELTQPNVATVKQFSKDDQHDIPLEPPNSNGSAQIFIKSGQATEFRKMVAALKLTPAEAKTMLKKNGIASIEKIPADKFEKFKEALEFLAQEKKEGITG